MVKQHHQLSEHELGQTLGDSEGKGSLVFTVHGSQRVGHSLVTEQQQSLKILLMFPTFKGGKNTEIILQNRKIQQKRNQEEISKM